MAKLPTLTTAEKKLIAGIKKGEEAVFLVKDKKTGAFDLEDPLNDPANGEKWPKNRTIRAKILRRILVDPPKSWPVHAKGVRIIGARIEGELDLEESKIKCPIFLMLCHVEEPISLQGAETKGLDFIGSHIPSINGERIKVTGNVILNDACLIKDGISLESAEISGHLSCDGGTLENDNPKGFALYAQNIRIKGSVFLRNGFSAKGGVSFMGAEIGGQFECNGGAFENDKPDGFALEAQNATVKGSFYLRRNFSAKGGVMLSGAEIGGIFDCDDGTFENENKKSHALDAQTVTIKGNVFFRGAFSAKGGVTLSNSEIGGQLECVDGTFINKKSEGNAFNIQGARVAGGFFWKPAPKLVGRINFQYASVDGPIADSKTGWPKKGQLYMDGFEYKAIAPGSDIDADTRIEWLRLQPQKKNRFIPQPYEHLIKILRQMGHEADARKVGIAKQEDLRRFGGLKWTGKFWNWTLGVAIAHGYRPWNALYWMVAVVFVGWLVFTNAQTLHAIHPSKERVLLDPRYIESGGRWLPLNYPKFSTIMYSVDVFLPIVDFHQESYWLPGKHEQAWFWGWGFKIWLWAEILFGWLLTTIAVAGLTGIVKKD